MYAILHGVVRGVQSRAAFAGLGAVRGKLADQTAPWFDDSPGKPA